MRMARSAQKVTPIPIPVFAPLLRELELPPPLSPLNWEGAKER